MAIEKSKSWGPFWSYQRDSSTNPVHLAHFWGKMGWIGTAVYLAGSSKTANRILTFSIAMVADYSFDVKNIDILAPAFFKHNNSFIATVPEMGP